MKVEVPKDARGATFTRLFTWEMNNFEVEELLPGLFFVIVSGGRRPRGRRNDPKDLQLYLDRLVEHERLEGFDDEAGRAMLDRWVRSSIARIGRTGKSRAGEQIRYVQPLTLLTYKTGMPQESGRRRRVDLYLYRAMVGVLKEAGIERPSAALGKIFQEAFGAELVIGPAPEYDGRYDGTSDVDLHTLLALCYLDGFDATPADQREAELLEDSPSNTPSMPAVTRHAGEDLLRYVRAYATRVPTLQLTRGLMTLIDVHLFTATVKLLFATEQLVLTGELPPAMTDQEGPTPPELYVDFTRERGSVSDTVAQACVDRDLEALGRFLPALMRLKALERFVLGSPRLRAEVEGLDSPDYLRTLVRLGQSEERVDVRAEAEIDTVRSAAREAADNDAEREEIDRYLDDLTERHADDLVGAYVELLVQQQARNLNTAFGKWFWSTGGLRNTHGLIEGNIHGRRRARYVMSDELLATLVQTAMIEDPSGRLENVGVRPTYPLGEFLTWMERRFGFIVDRPPAFMDDSSTRAAARQNLEALKRRLRQMGYFEALSDDFAAQFLRDPQYTREVPA